MSVRVVRLPPVDEGRQTWQGRELLAACLRAVLRGLDRLHLVSGSSGNDAATLGDRHLADIGLMRCDLPDHRGWRR